MSRFRILAVIVLFTVTAGASWAAVVPPPSERFEDLIVFDPVARVGTLAERPEALPDFGDATAGWNAFSERNGRWSVWIDRRSGAPLLAQGNGIRWIPVDGSASVDELEAKARDFLEQNALLFRIDPGQLVLNPDATAPNGENRWLITFDRVVDGIPVEGQRVQLNLAFGRLISFGAGRWGTLAAAPEVVIDREDALAILLSYMRLDTYDLYRELEDAELVLIPVPVAGVDGEPTVGRYLGPVGGGVEYRLVWRFKIQVDGEPQMWVAKIDAVDGDVLAFFDDVKYAQAKGGVYPITPEEPCPGGPCEKPFYPMPWADISLDGGPAITTNDMGLFECTPGTTATTTLISDFVRISDTCGAVSESVACDEDLDLDVGPGQDCDVPAGASAGNTHSARTAFYHLNRVKERGRYWLPSRTWLSDQLRANVNINNNCNATWNGNVNFYTSGGGCRNTGEIAGVVHHEFGHGIDSNDGGGSSSSGEAYADVVSIFQERQSCIGPGFRVGVTCSGYGDACESCTGIRDHDWDARAAHTPATPANFTEPNCGSGSGPCGRAVHCESYVPSESIYDFATRDLPAAGIDPDTAWQIAERLWWGSRLGTGGQIINCSLPNADSCTVDSWMQQMRTADDDDGDLSNGTPHGAAIFAAFDRHEISCGAASDPENQSTSSCPAMVQPTLTGSTGNQSAQLSWTDVPGAQSYEILRTEVGCDYSQIVVAEVTAPTTSFTDVDLANDFEFFYRVQARGSNPACDSPVSNCIGVTPLPLAGSIKLDRATYGCSTLINITVRDANIGASTTDITIWSDSEPTPETITLTETAPDSGRYVGSIQATDGPAANGDGLLSIAHLDAISAEYFDDDDGEGGSGPVQTGASGDCVGPSIFDVGESGVTDVAATINWQTDEPADSRLRWGEVTPPANEELETALVTGHSISLSGLQSCTVYFYEVESQDPSGNVAVADRGGQYFSFETLGDFGQGLQACHQGQISLDDSVVGCSNSLPVRVVDIDLNADSLVVDTVVVSVTSTTETVAELLTLTETGNNTSIFTGSIPTAAGPMVIGDGILQTHGGDLLTATYNDADDGTGAPATAFVTGDADCGHSGITNLRVTAVTDESARVEWSTGEPSTSTIEWGPTPALGNFAENTSLLSSHGFDLAVLTECDRFYFRVTSTDRHGNTVFADAAGAPFEFNAFEIPGAIFKDEFGSDTGWSLEGEWEIDPPQGLGSGTGDPTAPFDESRVLGHDLTGLGGSPGDYEAAVEESAISPSADASALSQVELKFRRRLNVGGGAISSVDVSTGGAWTTVWNSDSIVGQSDSDWVLQTIDVTAEAAGAANVQVRFRQKGGFSSGANNAGWNVDRFLIRDGAQPDWDACGSCGGAPSFAGLDAAVDTDPCADSDVQLSWADSPSWGSGNGGSYNVYRSTDPEFTPSTGNLIASGVVGTGYNDISAPDDVTLHYIVRAENNETCDFGPNNSGVEDGNLVRLAVRDDTSQTLPGSVGDTLLVDDVNQAHVRLSWGAVVDAAQYVILRGADPQGPFTEIGTVADTLFEDRDEMGTGEDRYYLVKAADACGNQGP